MSVVAGLHVAKGPIKVVAAAAIAGMFAGKVSCHMLDLATIQGIRILGASPEPTPDTEYEPNR